VRLFFGQNGNRCLIKLQLSQDSAGQTCRGGGTAVALPFSQADLQGGRDYGFIDAHVDPASVR
jgi:hypothetical protein